MLAHDRRTQASDSNGTAEDFLRLCLCGRRHPDSLLAAQALTVAPGWDWDEVLRLAQREAVAPLIFSIVDSQHIVPPAIERRLQELYFKNAARNMVLINKLEEVVAALNAAGCRTILLKGAALVSQYYDNMALRTLGDLDILVAEEALPAAVAALEGLGYDQLMTVFRLDVLRTLGSEVSFRRTEAFPISIDLHWQMIGLHYYQRDTLNNWLWTTAQPVRAGKTPCLILGPEASLLHMAAHLFLHHNGSGLRWWQDLAEVINLKRDTIDWDMLLERAQAFNLVLCLRGMITGLASQWEVAIPQWVLPRLEEMPVASLENRLFAAYNKAHRSPAQRLWDKMMDLPGWNARLRYCSACLFPSRAYLRKRWGARGPLLFLYYPYRWLRGLRVR